MALLALQVVSTPMPVQADQSGAFLFQTIGRTIAITGCTSADSSVAIPPAINGLPVTTIADRAFDYNATLASISIPGTVNSIGISAFRHCLRLTNVDMAVGVASIGNNAFESCTSLTNIVIPKSVTSIGVSPFYFCSSLTNITVDSANPNYESVDGVLYNQSQTSLIQWPCAKPGSHVTPASVTSIGDGAFAGSSLLTNIVVGSGITNIGNLAFQYCSSIPDVAIPSGVIHVGDQAFRSCSSLTNITVDPANPAYKSVDGVLYNHSQTTLIQCPGGRSGTYEIPDAVTNIGTGAFANCAQLTNVTIPNSVTTLGTEAFSTCTGLTAVELPNGVIGLGDGAFEDCSDLESVTIPGSVTRLGAYLFYNCYKLKNVTIGNGVISLGDYVFASCIDLTAVVIGNSVTNMGINSFDGCSSLAGLYFTTNSAQAEQFWPQIPAGVTIYHTPWSTGWTSSFHGHPTALWDGGTHEAAITIKVNGVGTVSGLTDGQLVEVLTTNTITAIPGPGYVFSKWTSDQLPTTDSLSLTFMMQPNLSITANFIDRQAPSLTITEPQAGEVVYASSVNVTLAVSDNGPISNVWVRVGSGRWVSAVQEGSSSNWTASIVPPTGTNILSAYAMDAGGNLSATSTVAFVFTPDRERPKISITSPRSGQVISNSPIAVSGTFADVRPVSNVWVRLGSQEWTRAQINPEQNSWSVSANPQLGANTLSAFMMNSVGNCSLTSSVQFVYLKTDRLNLIVSGLGNVSPNYSNAVLQLGKVCSMTATPAKGYVFSNWTGSAGQVLSAARTLRFTMTQGLLLEANFVVNPFTLAAGIYQGLYTNVDGAELAGAGIFSMNITTNGTYSGSIQEGLTKLPFSGALPLTGILATNVGKGANARAVSLNLDLTGGRSITGGITGNGRTLVLNANRAAHSKARPAPEAGKYTLATAMGRDSAREPGGHGYGNVIVDPTGNVTISATLGDGTKAQRSSIITTPDLCPVYIPLYSGKGALFGWLNFTNSELSDMEGALAWAKPAGTTATTYPSGFSLRVQAIGSRLNSHASPMLPLTNMQLVIDGASLGLPQTNAIVSLIKNAATGPNISRLSITPASGLFSCKVTNHVTGKPITINGAILQKAGVGYGLFMGFQQTGSAVLEDRP